MAPSTGALRRKARPSTWIAELRGILESVTAEESTGRELIIPKRLVQEVLDLQSPVTSRELRDLMVLIQHRDKCLQRVLHPQAVHALTCLFLRSSSVELQQYGVEFLLRIQTSLFELLEPKSSQKVSCTESQTIQIQQNLITALLTRFADSGVSARSRVQAGQALLRLLSGSRAHFKPLVRTCDGRELISILCRDKDTIFRFLAWSLSVHLYQAGADLSWSPDEIYGRKCFLDNIPSGPQDQSLMAFYTFMRDVTNTNSLDSEAHAAPLFQIQSVNIGKMRFSAEHALALTTSSDLTFLIPATNTDGGSFQMIQIPSEYLFHAVTKSSSHDEMSTFLLEYIIDLEGFYFADGIKRNFGGSTLSVQTTSDPASLAEAILELISRFRDLNPSARVQSKRRSNGVKPQSRKISQALITLDPNYIEHDSIMAPTSRDCAKTAGRKGLKVARRSSLAMVPLDDADEVLRKSLGFEVEAHHSVESAAVDNGHECAILLETQHLGGLVYAEGFSVARGIENSVGAGPEQKQSSSDCTPVRPRNLPGDITASTVILCTQHAIPSGNPSDIDQQLDNGERGESCTKISHLHNAESIPPSQTRLGCSHAPSTVSSPLSSAPGSNNFTVPSDISSSKIAMASSGRKGRRKPARPGQKKSTKRSMARSRAAKDAPRASATSEKKRTDHTANTQESLLFSKRRRCQGKVYSGRGRAPTDWDEDLRPTPSRRDGTSEKRVSEQSPGNDLPLTKKAVNGTDEQRLAETDTDKQQTAEKGVETPRPFLSRRSDPNSDNRPVTAQKSSRQGSNHTTAQRDDHARAGRDDGVADPGKPTAAASKQTQTGTASLTTEEPHRDSRRCNPAVSTSDRTPEPKGGNLLQPAASECLANSKEAPMKTVDLLQVDLDAEREKSDATAHVHEEISVSKARPKSPEKLSIRSPEAVGSAGSISLPYREADSASEPIEVPHSDSSNSDALSSAPCLAPLATQGQPSASHCLEGISHDEESWKRVAFNNDHTSPPADSEASTRRLSQEVHVAPRSSSYGDSSCKPFLPNFGSSRNRSREESTTENKRKAAFGLESANRQPFKKPRIGIFSGQLRLTHATGVEMPKHNREASPAEPLSAKSVAHFDGHTGRAFAPDISSQSWNGDEADHELQSMEIDDGHTTISAPSPRMNTPGLQGQWRLSSRTTGAVHSGRRIIVNENGSPRRQTDRPSHWTISCARSTWVPFSEQLSRVRSLPQQLDHEAEDEFQRPLSRHDEVPRRSTVEHYRRFKPVPGMGRPDYYARTPIDQPLTFAERIKACAQGNASQKVSAQLGHRDPENINTNGSTSLAETRHDSEVASCADSDKENHPTRHANLQQPPTSTQVCQQCGSDLATNGQENDKAVRPNHWSDRLQSIREVAQNAIADTNEQLMRCLAEEKTQIEQVLNIFQKETSQVLDQLFEAQERRIELHRQQVQAVRMHHAQLCQDLIKQLQDDSEKQAQKRITV